MKYVYDDAEFYDLVTNYKTDDIDFIIEIAQEYGGPILELAAGTGRIAIPLIERGFDYTGLDLSASFVKRANKKIAQIKGKGEVLIGDMCDFKLKKLFKLILLPFNSIFHLMSENVIESCLACVYNHLQTDGIFLIDMFVPNKKYLMRDPNKFYPVGGDYEDSEGKAFILKERTKYDPVTEINQIKAYAYYENEDEPQVYNYEHYMIPPARIQRILHEIGFTIDNIFGDYGKNIFSKESPLQIYLCSK